jgi:hypothetical protein
MSSDRVVEVSRGRNSRWSNDHPGRTWKPDHRAKGRTDKKLSRKEEGKSWAVESWQDQTGRGSSADRTGSQAGRAKTPLRTLCGRQQHLCQKRTSRGASAGQHPGVHREADAAESEQGEKCSGPGDETQVSGLQLLLKSRRSGDPSSTAKH